MVASSKVRDKIVDSSVIVRLGEDDHEKNVYGLFSGGKE